MSGAGHFLTLTQIAETHHSVRTSRIEGVATKTFDEVFGQLISQGWTQDQLFEAVCKQVHWYSMCLTPKR